MNPSKNERFYNGCHIESTASGIPRRSYESNRRCPRRSQLMEYLFLQNEIMAMNDAIQFHHVIVHVTLVTSGQTQSLRSGGVIMIRIRMSLAVIFGTFLSVDETEHGDGRTKMSRVVKRSISSRGDGGGTVGQRSPLS